MYFAHTLRIGFPINGFACLLLLLLLAVGGRAGAAEGTMAAQTMKAEANTVLQSAEASARTMVDALDKHDEPRVRRPLDDKVVASTLWLSVASELAIILAVVSAWLITRRRGARAACPPEMVACGRLDGQ